MYELKDLPSWSPQTRKGKPTLYAFFRKPWDKKQTCIDLGVSNESEARARAPALLLKYLNDNGPNAVVKTSHTFADFREEFIKDEYIGKKKGTRDAVRYTLDHFIDQLKNPLIDAMDWPTFRDYVDGVKAEGYAAKGTFNRIVNLRKFFGYLVARKVMLENCAEKYPLPSTAEFYRNEITWEKEEFVTYYNASAKADQQYLWVLYHTGMDIGDWFGLRRKHIVWIGGKPIITKLRMKATTPNQVIKFPLEHCPAKDVILAAYALTKGPEDRLFATEYADDDFDQFVWTSRTRRNRLWMCLFPDVKFKTLKQLRHTFITEAVGGKRFGKQIPMYALEMWLGWTAGSRVGQIYYVHVQASETGDFMQQAVKAVS